MTNYDQMVASAASAYGEDPGELYGIAKLESGFNPTIANTTDSNARAGHPSVGIVQYIPSTFQSHMNAAIKANPAAWAGVKRDIYNPQAQLLAAAWGLTHNKGHAWSTYGRAQSFRGKLPAIGSGSLPQPSTIPPPAVASSSDPTADAILARHGGISPIVLSLLAQDDAGPAAAPTSQAPPGAAATSIDPGALPKGVANFGGKQVAAWIAPVLEYARQHGWKGGVNSGYRSLADQTRIWNSGVRPAAKPGTSNHEMTAFPGGAIDVSDPQGLSSIIARSPYKGLLVWAGAKDPVHFSHPHNGSY